MDSESSLLVLIVQEHSGMARINEPVTVGIPFPAGEVARPEVLFLQDADGRACPLQIAELARWPDGSLKWALVDFFANVGAHAETNYQVGWGRRDSPAAAFPPLRVERTANHVVVDTGAAAFFINRK